MQSSNDALLAAARDGWSLLAGLDGAFAPGQIRVHVQARSALAPKEWTGIVALGDAVLAVAPSRAAAEVVRGASAGLYARDLEVIDVLARRIEEYERLGPTPLFFGKAIEAHDMRGVVSLNAASPQLWELFAATPSEELHESGLPNVRSPVFVILDGERVLSACGYNEWPGRLAHIAVLTHPDARQRGLARAAATAAVTHALDAGLTVQWRARPDASQALARSLGLVELGRQLALRL